MRAKFSLPPTKLPNGQAETGLKVNVDKPKKWSAPSLGRVFTSGQHRGKHQRTETFMLLGVMQSDNLNRGHHAEYLLNKCSRDLYLLVLLRHTRVAFHDMLRIYTSMVLSVPEYACQVWHTSVTKEQLD